jgi:hypothetical protein
MNPYSSHSGQDVSYRVLVLGDSGVVCPYASRVTQVTDTIDILCTKNSKPPLLVPNCFIYS